MRERESLCLCLCLCACERERVCVFVCVCVCEREMESEREREREREKGQNSEVRCLGLHNVLDCLARTGRIVTQSFFNPLPPKTFPKGRDFNSA